MFKQSRSRRLVILIGLIVFAVIGYLVLNNSKAATNADIDNNGSVGISDLTILAANYGLSGKTFSQGDITGDGTVNIYDFSILAAQWGNSGSGGTQTTNCPPNPHLCGFADATNTGILAGVTLTKIPSQATSGSGWSYSASTNTITITGNVGSATTGIEAEDGVTVGITGSNLTVQNLKIDGAHGTSTDAVMIGASTNGVTIDHCDLQGASSAEGQATPRRGWNGIHVKGGANNFSIKHCNVHGFIGGLFPELTKGNDTFIGNYVHQLSCWNFIDNNSDCSAGAAKGGDHCNGWADGSGVATGDTTSTMLIQDNTLLADNNGCVSGALSFFNDGGSNGHLNAHAVVNHNLLGTTSGYLFSTDQYQSPYFSYIGITNNAFFGIGSNQPAIWRDVNPYFSWPIGATANQYNNYNCGNYWDTSTFRGTTADTNPNYANSNWFTNVQPHMEALVKCLNPLPWSAPTGWVDYSNGGGGSQVYGYRGTPGIPAGTNLTTYSGPTTITTNGTVLDGVYVAGGLTISADNVTIKNSHIDGPGGDNNPAIDVKGRNVTISHNLIGNTAQTLSGHFGVKIESGGNHQITGNDIWHIHGGVYMWADGVTSADSILIQDNWVHQMTALAGDHMNNLTSECSYNVTVDHNRLEGTVMPGSPADTAFTLSVYSDDQSCNVTKNSPYLGTDGLRKGGIQNLTFTNNYGDGHGSYGLWVIDAIGTLVFNNNMESNSGFGYWANPGYVSWQSTGNVNTNGTLYTPIGSGQINTH